MNGTRIAEVLERYEDAGRWARWHVRGRLLSCPFDKVIETLPRSGLIASLGCGHGVFEILAALDGPGRRILAADVDAPKIAIARRAARELPITFEEGDVLERLEQRAVVARAIVVVDVLSLIPREDHGALLRRARNLLEPGGSIVLKEMDVRPRWKHIWNFCQETLSCRVLRITRAPAGYTAFRSSASWCGLLSEAGFLDVEARRVDRGYPHAHLLVTGRRPLDATPEA